MFKLRTNLTEQCPCESGKTYADCCFRKGVAYLNIFFIALALAIITVGFWPWNLIAVAIPAEFQIYLNYKESDPGNPLYR